MLSEQLTEQQRTDGFLLARIKEDPDVWAAFQRVLAKLNDDGIRQWTDNEGVKKAWLKGFREALSLVVPNIEQRILDSRAVVEEEKHAAEVARSPSEDGVGLGDLAIA